MKASNKGAFMKKIVLKKGAENLLDNCMDGFTLAEILITLAIIGVVATMTIPTLIANYQKEQVVSEYKKAYSEISQALKMAEVTNGASETWTWSSTINLALTQKFADTYLYPNLKILKKCAHTDNSCWANPALSLDNTSSYINVATAGKPNALSAITASGYSILFWAGGNPWYNHVWIWVDIDGPKKGEGKLGKDIFGGMCLVLGETGTKKGIVTSSLTRDELKNHTTHGCNKNISGKTGGYYCGDLIIKDGWEISNDYPWN